MGETVKEVCEKALIIVFIILFTWGVFCITKYAIVDKYIKIDKMKNGITPRFDKINIDNSEYMFKFLYLGEEISNITIIGEFNITENDYVTGNVCNFIFTNPVGGKYTDMGFERDYVERLIALCKKPDEFNLIVVRSGINKKFQRIYGNLTPGYTLALMLFPYLLFVGAVFVILYFIGEFIYTCLKYICCECCAKVAEKYNKYDTIDMTSPV